MQQQRCKILIKIIQIQINLEWKDWNTFCVFLGQAGKFFFIKYEGSWTGREDGNVPCRGDTE